MPLTTIVCNPPSSHQHPHSALPVATAELSSSAPASMSAELSDYCSKMSAGRFPAAQAGPAASSEPVSADGPGLGPSPAPHVTPPPLSPPTARGSTGGKPQPSPWQSQLPGPPRLSTQGFLEPLEGLPPALLPARPAPLAALPVLRSPPLARTLLCANYCCLITEL